MSNITVTRQIVAPVEDVFQTVARIDNLSKAIPHIVKVEFLSDVTSGVGTRFRETRLMKGKEATTELEVTEYQENERIRIISESHGTIWDTVFTVRPAGGSTELELFMEARSESKLSRLMNRAVMKMVAKALESDMDAVKVYCEKK